MNLDASVSLSFNNSEINRVFRLGYLNPFWTLDGISRGFNVGYSEVDAGARLNNTIRYSSKTCSAAVTTASTVMNGPLPQMRRLSSIAACSARSSA